MRIDISFNEEQANKDITLILNAQRAKELKEKILNSIFTDGIDSFVVPSNEFPTDKTKKEETKKE